LGGITPRTIRNWKTGNQIYSERSSQIFNALFKRNIRSNSIVDNRSLAWLWVAYGLKLTEPETDDFLVYCMGDQRGYILNPVELAVRTCLAFNNQPRQVVWQFFDAVNFGLQLQQEIDEQIKLPESKPSFNLSAYTHSIMASLAASKTGDCTQLANRLSAIYENGLKHLTCLCTQLREESRLFLSAPVLTRYVESIYRQQLRQTELTLPAVTGSPDIVEMKDILSKWIREKAGYFTAAHLSKTLALLHLLIELITDMSGMQSNVGFFEQWYFWCSLVISQTLGVSTDLFPSDPAGMADVLWRDEGLEYSGYAKQHCLTYFSRLFDEKRHLRRNVMIEFYLLTRLNHSHRSELDRILLEQRYLPLDSKSDRLLIGLFAYLDKNINLRASPETFTRLLATFGAMSDNEDKNWPIREKLFFWDYPAN
jgi:hypothetical protein